MAVIEPRPKNHDVWITVATAVVASAVVVFPTGVSHIVRIAVVLPILLFVPGYLVVAALYPRSSDGSSQSVPHTVSAVRSRSPRRPGRRK